MPIAVTYPGVYVQELPSSVRTIVGVPTSVAAFVGAAVRGPLNVATRVNSWPEYARTFGGLDNGLPMSWAVYLFFLNGGAAAEIVRAGDQVGPVKVDLGGLDLEASSPGSWGQSLRVTVDQENLTDAQKADQFNLTVEELDGGEPITKEFFPAVPITKVDQALRRSTLVRVSDTSKPLTKAPTSKVYTPAGPPADGNGAPAPPDLDPKFTVGAVVGADVEGRGGGIYALAKADIFNMLILPALPEEAYSNADLGAAAEFCEKMRAVLIVDPPATWTGDSLAFATVSQNPAIQPPSSHAAVYYPNLKVTDMDGALHTVGPSGAVAGVWANTDRTRGVWKAPAGTQASIAGVTDFAAKIDDASSGVLNPLAVNALRTLPLYGPVIWGARTSVGADSAADQWKYLPVRRTALFIEESLRRGSQWVVFEPNDEPLWSSLRLNFGAFMNNLWRQGAFQGSTPRDAYFVKCDKDVNPQNQIDLGIVNIIVGFAPLKPAEFLIISIQQLAGQLQT